jgi:hypothetical protein
LQRLLDVFAVDNFVHRRWIMHHKRDKSTLINFLGEYHSQTSL